MGAGTLIQNNWAGVQFALPFIFISAILLLFNGKNFDLLLLGDEGATGLGLATERVKLIGWILAITLAAATVSVVGPIGFIGLMAPHIVRLLGIKGHRQQFIHTFVWGAFLLIAADALARFVQPGGEIPVGAMTAIVGGPWLMYLAYRMGKRYASSKITLNGRESSLPLPILYAALILSTFGVALVSLMYGGGSFDSVQDLISGSLFQEFSVRYRWPRILTAFLVGALLALCGVLLQSVLRNPLGDPSILGITSGGGAGALTIIVLFPTLSFAFVPVGAVVGSTLAIVTILLATKRSYWEPISLALMGVAVSAVGSGIIQILTVKATIGVAPALLWLAGSTYGMNWQNVYFLVSILVLLVPISYWLSKELDLLGLHQQVSTGLGLNVKLMRIGTIILAVIIGSATVAVVGAIGFIGLLAPHAARGLVGTKITVLYQLQ
nr:iron ABC transporter permease [Geomicrobium sp. JCM 19055]